MRAPGPALPRWVAGFLRQQSPQAFTRPGPQAFSRPGPQALSRPGPRTAAARMRIAIGLARENARRGTGGPFGAAVFERRSGRLIAVGVNAVLASGCSLWHAETMAVALAQRARGGFDLGASGPDLVLISSSEPCAMCFGALPWSGLRALVCGARAADAERIGFDEGPKPRRWIEALEARAISVRRDVCRAEAVAVLRAYAAAGGEIYNAGQRARRARRRSAPRPTRSGPRDAPPDGSGPPGRPRRSGCRRG